MRLLHFFTSSSSLVAHPALADRVADDVRSISCLYHAFKHVGGFVEWYALYGSNQPTTNYLDTGLFIYLTPNVQLDCVIGTSVNTPDNNTVFTKAGFSTRW